MYEYDDSFDDSFVRGNLNKQFRGLANSNKIDPSLYVFKEKPPQAITRNIVNFGIRTSNKYDIPRTHTIHHHPVKLPDSNFTPISNTDKLQFGAVDMSKFFSVHNKTIKLDNYAGQTAQAEGIHNDNEFFMSQARKEGREIETVYHTDPDHIAQFMNRPRIQNLLTNATEQKVYTEEQRQEEHHQSKGVKVKRAMAPEVKPAFEEAKGDDFTADKVYPEGVVGTVFNPMLSKDEKERLQAKVIELEQHEKAAKKFTQTRMYKKAVAKKQDKSQKATIENIVESNEREDALKRNKEEQAAVKEKINKLVEARLNKKNAGKSQKEEEEEEEDEEKKEEEKGEKNDDWDNVLGEAFDKEEKKILKDFIKDNQIDTSKGFAKVREQIRKHLPSIKATLKEFKNPINWIRRFLSIYKFAPVPDEDDDGMFFSPLGPPPKKPKTPETVRRRLYPIKVAFNSNNTRTKNHNDTGP